MLAVVTGANKGLGLAIVKELCEKFNGTVYLTSRDETRGQAACKSLQELGLNPRYHQLDIIDDGSISKFLTYIEKTYKKIDLLINNAGILFLKDAREPFQQQVEQTMSVNFFSLVHFCESVLPFIKSGGKIVNISSSSGHLSRIPSQSVRNRLLKEDLTVEELKKLLSSYVEDVKAGREVSDTWGDSPYVVSKVGVNAYTFILHRRLAKQGKIWFVIFTQWILLSCR